MGPLRSNSRCAPAVLALVTITFATLAASPAFAGKIRQVFAFGDQAFDTGMSRFFSQSVWKATAPPYGQDWGKISGRFSNGRLVLDFITFRLGLPSLFAYHHAQPADADSVHAGAQGQAQLEASPPLLTLLHPFPSLPFQTRSLQTQIAVHAGTRSLQTQIAYMQEYGQAFTLTSLLPTPSQPFAPLPIPTACRPATRSLQTQIAYMQEYKDKRQNNPQVTLDQSLIMISAGTNNYVLAILMLDQSLIMISAGTNDYVLALLGQSGGQSVEQVLSATTGAIIKAVQDLNAMTKTTKIVVFDVPPLGCIPADLNAMTKATKIAVFDVPLLGCIPAVRYFKKTPAGECDEASNKIASDLNAMTKTTKIVVFNVPPLGCIRAVRYFKKAPSLLLGLHSPHHSPPLSTSSPDLNAMTKTTKIVVFDVPPLGCIPAVRYFKKTPAGQCDAAANKLADQHNTGVRVKLDKLRQQGVTNLILFKQSTVYRVKGTTAGGFIDQTSVCCEGKTPSGKLIACGQTVKEGGKSYSATACKDPTKYVWWDWYNPTEAFNEVLSGILWHSNSVSYVSPFGLKAIVDK
ncbi:unnamed protein product [Closterium sp. NIES-65]|nr:unnamed protein product [Closterium sp. NIES-65]